MSSVSSEHLRGSGKSPATLVERPARPAPIPAGVEYHRVLAGEKRRIGRGILAIMLLLVGAIVIVNVIARGTAVIDLQMGNTTPILGGTDHTPLYHLRVDLGTALQDRSAGVGSPYQLVPTLTVVVITAVVWWRTRRTGPALTPAHTPLRPDARLGTNGAFADDPIESRNN